MMSDTEYVYQMSLIDRRVLHSLYGKAYCIGITENNGAMLRLIGRKQHPATKALVVPIAEIILLQGE